MPSLPPPGAIGACRKAATASGASSPPRRPAMRCAGRADRTQDIPLPARDRRARGRGRLALEGCEQRGAVPGRAPPAGSIQELVGAGDMLIALKETELAARAGLGVMERRLAHRGRSRGSAPPRRVEGRRRRPVRLRGAPRGEPAQHRGGAGDGRASGKRRGQRTGAVRDIDLARQDRRRDRGAPLVAGAAPRGRAVGPRRSGALPRPAGRATLRRRAVAAHPGLPGSGRTGSARCRHRDRGRSRQGRSRHRPLPHGVRARPRPAPRVPHHAVDRASDRGTVRRGRPSRSR